MATSQDQIDGIRKVCRLLEQQPDIKAAHVDDWGRFGNFTVFVTPQSPDRHTTQKVGRWVKSALAQSGCTAHVREVFAPDRIRRRTANGKLKVVGYARSAWTVDIDYQRYDSQSNSFA